VTAGTIMHASKLPLTMWFWTLLVIGARTTPAPYRVLIRKAA
jgi:hypothetical protein